MFQVTDGHVRKNFAIYLEGKLALTGSVHSELDHLGTAKSAHSTINFGLLGLTNFHSAFDGRRPRRAITLAGIPPQTQ